MIRILLENGADVNAAVNGIGYTALHTVAYGGEPDEIDALVEAGANLDARAGHNLIGNESQTPLHLAGGHLTVWNMAALLRQGADVNARDSKGETPLHQVCERARELLSDEAADLLLRWGADETITNKDGCTHVDLVKSDASSTGRRLQRVLANAPADRAWRRRGTLVMCRARSDQTRSRDGEGRAGKAIARDGADSRRGSGNVMTRVVGLEDDGIFRYILFFCEGEACVGS